MMKVQEDLPYKIQINLDLSLMFKIKIKDENYHMYSINHFRTTHWTMKNNANLMIFKNSVLDR